MNLNVSVQDMRSFGCSRQGAAHKVASPPALCQDAHLAFSGSVAGRDYVFAAVADGHGSEKYDRSHIGAHLAVHGAARTFCDFVMRVGDQSPDQLSKLFKTVFPKAIIQEWKNMVKNHGAPEGIDSPDDLKALSVRYGTTLIFAGAVADMLLLAQLGDGDLVVFSGDSNSPHEPLACQDDHVGGETFSLCSSDAANLMRATSMELGQTRAVMLSTDGLRNAYDSEEKFYNLLSAMIKNVDQYGMPKAADIVPQYLDMFSEKGSGDDMTLVCLMNRDKAAGNTASTVQSEEDTGEVQVKDTYIL